MKKNLLILVVLLAAVAVVSRLTRNAGEDAEWAALRKDEVQCLQAMWGKAPQVELLPTRDGLVLAVTQAYADEVRPAHRRWSFDVAWLVARRHPQVKVVDLKVSDVSSGTALPQRPDVDEEHERTELLRRQRQAEADQIMPGTLVLLDVYYQEPVNGRVQMEQRRAPANGRPAPQEADSGAPALESAPIVRDTFPTASFTWLVTPTDPSPALLDKLKPIERVVRLPNP